MTNSVVRRNQYRVMDPWQEMDRVFDAFLQAPVRQAAGTEPRKPVVNVVEGENGITMTAELPGFGPEDLDIQVKENLLIIRALEKPEKEEEERKAAFERSFVLPEDLKRDAIDAEMKNGLLTLSLPKKEKPAPLAIKVKG